MNPDTIFGLSGPVAIVGWLALIASPWLPTVAERIAGLVIPALLSVAYTGLILAFWSTAQGGFDTLDNVALLFDSREMLLAGWLHYLAFDLFVGAWIVRTARADGISFWFVLPCLPLTFLFGPAGYLAFVSLRTVLPARRQAVAS